MATTDTKVDLVINELTEEKLKELEDAGTVAPNQLWGTPDVSGDDNVERVETIYDMTSSDSAVNWGYTSGIQGGVAISGKNFSKYKRLRFYGYTNWYKQSYEISTEENSKYGKITTESPEATNRNSTFILSTIRQDGFGIAFYQVLLGTSPTTWNLKNNDSTYYIYKIEGVY